MLLEGEQEPDGNSSGDEEDIQRKNSTSFSSLYKEAATLVWLWCCVPVSNCLARWKVMWNYEWDSTAKYASRLFVIGNRVIWHVV